MILWLLGAASATAPLDLPPPGASFARAYVVIVATEREPSALDAAAVRLAPLVPAPARLASSDYSGLNPCWHLLVAAATPSRDAAMQAAAALEAAGVDVYVRATRDLVPEAERAARCAPPPETPHGVWMVADGALVLGATDRATPAAGPPVGAKVQVVSRTRSDAVCTVTAIETRPVGYGGGALGADACADADLVAVLDPSCPSGDIAVPLDAPTPIIFDAAPDAALEAALHAELQASSEADLRARLTGRGDGLPVQITPGPASTWTGPEGRVVVAALDGLAPYQEPHCGDDGERARIVHGVWIRPDGRREVLFTQFTDPYAELVAIVDVNADGTPEAWWAEGSHSGLEDAKAPIRRIFCGCPC